MRYARIATVVALALFAWRCLPFCDNSCLVSDTVVETPNGPRPLGELVVGDHVWAVRTGDGTRVPRRITAITTSWAFDLRHPVINGKAMHGVTGRHPFFLADEQRWVKASELEVGTVVMGGAGRETLRGLHDEHAWLVPQRVHDLSLEGPEHTFIADGALVHNKTVDYGEIIFEDEAYCRCFASAAGLERGLTVFDAGPTSPITGRIQGSMDGGLPWNACVVTEGTYSKLTRLECANRGIRSARVSRLPMALRELVLADNEFESIDNAVVSARLLLLDLSGNPLTDVGPLNADLACTDHPVVKLAGTLLGPDDNPALARLAELGCLPEPSSF